MLFISIEPIKDKEKYGKYLLITRVNLLKEAQTFIDKALEHMSTATPDNILWITKTDGSSVTHTNGIAMSTRFQSYALQSMISMTIMTTIPSNAWKCHPTAVLNYSDEEYPTIDGSKKQCMNDTAPTDNSTNVDMLAIP